MTGKAHMGIGVLTAVVILDKASLGISPVAILVCIFASLLPDSDHPKGFFNKYILPMRNKVAKITLYILVGLTIIGLNYFYFNKNYLYALGAVIILIGISSHRQGITHSLIGFVLFVYILGYGSEGINMLERERIIIAFIAGYLSHLIGDLFTNRGVPLIYPLSKRKFKMPLTYRVGSGVGNLIEGIIITLAVVYLAFAIPTMIIKMN
ncbi:MAG: metal-dependent hydrolase [Clostridium sp.]|uniref:metal-dependent hydrolase n=1 Tax=Clostridium sp. TaxID=1506 RepID=UPI002FC99B4C